MPIPAIKVKELEKTYKSDGPSPEKHAIKGINLEIPRGSMFGLLGPNGAGKSTFINILAGLVNKTSGEANVWGFDIDKNPRNARASIGVVPQELHYDAFFTPREIMELQAGLFGVKKSDRRTMEILEMVKLADKADAYSRTLSGGMKRRLLVAKAMVHSPPILVLDEPTAGVDIELRQQLWENVKELHSQGTTIVQIAIINHGEVVANEPTLDLLSRIDEKELIFDVGDLHSRIPEGLKPFKAQIRKDGRLTIQINKSTTTVNEILSAVSNTGLHINDISTHETDLEDIFLQLTKTPQPQVN
jgi:ABC-2 type transport system ATP-binding protein